MADSLTIDVDAKAVIALFDRMGPSAEFVSREVARESANRIVVEAKQRFRRSLKRNQGGVYASIITGETEAGIHSEPTRDGKGYVVLGYSTDNASDRGPVDLWFEWGTNKQYARPFLFPAAKLEEGPHRRRLQERMQEWLDRVGR